MFEWFEIFPYIVSVWIVRAVKRHFFSRNFSSMERRSIGAASNEKSLDGISPLTKTIMPPPNCSRSQRNGVENPGIQNLHCENELSSFVSEITKTSTIPMIIFISNSDLFLKELMLGSATVIHISLKLFNEAFSSIQRGSMCQKWVNKINLLSQILLTRNIVFVLLQFIKYHTWSYG